MKSVFFHFVLPAVLLLLTECSGGSLPSSGTLPTLDGSHLTNVNASSLNGTAASDLSVANATNATNATNAASAVFAAGKRGAPLVASAVLNLGSDGNSFLISGTAEIDALSAMPAGATVTLTFLDVLRLKESTSLKLAGAGDFRTAPGDIFIFISNGDGSWSELQRAVTNDSRVRVGLNADVAIPANHTAGTLFSFDRLLEDTQDEYQNGVFTAKQSGTYQLSLTLETLSAPWSPGGYCKLGVAADTETYFSATMGLNGSCSTSLSLTVQLLAGRSITPNYIIVDATNAHTLQGANGGLAFYNYMQIVRLKP